MDLLEIENEPSDFVIDDQKYTSGALEIKTETSDFVIDDRQHTQGPLDISNEPSEFVFQYFYENRIKNENPENGDFSSEKTIINVSSDSIHYVH